MTTPTPITFFGSDQYSATVLQSLINSPGITVTNLVTTNTPTAYPLHQLANSHNIPITFYHTLRDHPLSSFASQGILASFGHILPPSVLDLFPSGILCLHPSLLPQYRNTSPVPYTIALGDTTTGITLFQIDNTIDNGQIISQQSEPILPSDTSPILLHRLFALGAQLTTNHLTSPTRRLLVGKSKNQELTTNNSLIFTQKLTSESGHLEWDVTKKLINNQPITQSDTNNQLLKLRLSHSPPKTKNQEPRTILTDLIRALDGWEKVWTIAETKKGNLRIYFPHSQEPRTKNQVLISGKPNPISWADFTTYYLS